MSMCKRWTAVSVVCLLAACGGGGGGDTGTPTTAESCLDAGTFAAGTALSQKLSLGTRLDWTVGDPTTTYNQIPNLLKVSNDVYWEQPISGSLSYHRDFHISPVTTSEVTTHGTYYVAGSGLLRVALTEVFSAPYSDKRFTLKPSESLQYQYSGTATTESLSGPDAGTKTSNFTNTGTIKFDGLEDVAIGDRTVKACKFSEGSTKAWYYRGLRIQFENPEVPSQSFKTLLLTRNSQAY